jgi:hypothetical protein
VHGLVSVYFSAEVIDSFAIFRHLDFSMLTSYNFCTFLPFTLDDLDRAKTSHIKAETAWIDDIFESGIV